MLVYATAINPAASPVLASLFMFVFVVGVLALTCMTAGCIARQALVLFKGPSVARTGVLAMHKTALTAHVWVHDYDGYAGAKLRAKRVAQLNI